MTSAGEPVWLTRAMVEAMHADQIRAHGGRAGIREQHLLDSALARSQHRLAYDSDADLAALAADYAFGLTSNHPFLDGNKRVGLVAMNVFLILNGYEIDVPEPEAVAVMLRLAAGEMTVEELAAWIRESMRRR